MGFTQEISAEQRAALEQNQTLQSEARELENEIQYRARPGRSDSELIARIRATGATSAELSQRLRANLEQIKALNARELCANLVARR
jgi:seryl-tRNA synthetase